MASDDGFREIQLSGKQLVFLFMATTIVAVVIFLCGVMVGRGVKSPGTSAAAVGPAAVPTPDVQPLSDNPPVSRSEQATSAPAAGTASAAKDGQAPAASQPGGTKAADDQRSAPPDEPPPAVPDEPPTKGAPAAVGASANAEEPVGEGWVVQVTALADQAQCNAIVARLVSKGYPAYLIPPPPGGGVYRVRVGKFKERREADNVKRRLEKEEQLKPWITR